MKLKFILIGLLSVFVLTSCEKDDDLTLSQAEDTVSATGEEKYRINDINVDGDSIRVTSYNDTQGNTAYNLFYLKKGVSKEGKYSLIREKFIQILNYKNSLVGLNEDGFIYIANNTMMYARIHVEAFSKIKNISVQGEDLYATDERDKVYVYRGSKNTRIIIESWTSSPILGTIGAKAVEKEINKNTKPRTIFLVPVK